MNEAELNEQMMNLFYLGYYLALFFIPFVVYFLLFKKNEGRSIYTNRDWFYFIKLYYAKKAVKKYQEKYRTRALVELDIRISIPREKVCLQVLSVTKDILEIFQSDTHVLHAKLPKEQWKINGLNIEILEPVKRLRVTFSGLLKNVAVKDYEKVEHVQFNLIFNASGSPTQIPHDMDTRLLAEALARENWRDGSWVDYLIDQSGYELFGALQGFIKGDSYPKEYVVNLPACRSKYEGICDRYVLNRGLRIFVADVYGNLINIVIKSFKNGCSQLNYGSVILSNGKIWPIKGIDILLKLVGEHKNIPEVIITHLEVEQKLFKCVIHLNKSKALESSNNEQEGYDCLNIPAECEVNSNQARAVIEVLVQQKSTFLAIIISNAARKFLVPDGFIITINAYKRQLESSLILKKSLSLLDDICCGRREGKLEDICKETVNCFKKEKILPEIVEAVVTELKNIDGVKTIGWAVRSSAIGEDSEELSAAGQNETFLGCLTEKQILKSITACWASLYTYQSVQYRW
ncbi:hypothetical protein NQ314_003150 [Rhamnusium bicolor]|uniref:Pyruvate phosphate dikinase AMP/ATP-binding domain-containing protein n=1 Tax=Rhamnusium bicolor TaxID=1586634 RepID=A0AAV8ZNN8_9CUCU|nr:hypothetical protein NQ314_003150 [Rhamnusium bicolor]